MSTDHSARLRRVAPGLLVFDCPGCGYGHPFHVEEEGAIQKHARWEWNGSMDRPTFRPSLMVNGRDPATRCHSFVTDGRIQFLPDCHHALAGQTVDLPPVD